MGCAKVLTDALVKGGLKKPSKIAPNRGKGYVIILAEFPYDADLGAVAKKVNQALTPHREQAPPGVSLELYAKLDKQSAQAALTSLSKLKGVDGKRSTANVKRGVISIQLSGSAKISVNDVIAALKKANIDARIVITKRKPTAKSN